MITNHHKGSVINQPIFHGSCQFFFRDSIGFLQEPKKLSMFGPPGALPKRTLSEGMDGGFWMWVLPTIGVPQNKFVMENPIKMDDLGVPLFLEIPMYSVMNPGFWNPATHQLIFRLKVYMFSVVGRRLFRVALDSITLWVGNYGLYQWNFQRPPTMGPPYGKLPILFP